MQEHAAQMDHHGATQACNTLSGIWHAAAQRHVKAAPLTCTSLKNLTSLYRADVV